MELRFLMRWTLVTLLAFLVSIMLAPAPTMSARRDVIIGSFSWSGSNAIEQVMKYVLEKKLNVPVEIFSISTFDCWIALDNGSVDVCPDIWMPNQEPGFETYVRKRKTVAVKLSYDKAPQGFYMSAEIARAQGIKSIFDLKGNEKIFDTNGDGRGEIWVGPYGWDASEVNHSKIREYGLDLEPVKIDQRPFLAILKKAMRKGAPMVFYYWEPEWPVTKYDLVRLDEPPYDESRWIRVKGDIESSHISCSYPDASIYVGVSKKLDKRLPKAYKFFMNWYIPMDEVSFLIAEIENVPGNPKKDAGEVAKAWVESHPRIVKDWLDGIL
ncbi:MAG: hypothetical protein JSU72_02385 [Deltaproteobacteria bacterium]|nr:MAG: hypothetical protein JSU72_02385 [Deltaproteobacteria bacterium]